MTFWQIPKLIQYFRVFIQYRVLSCSFLRLLVISIFAPSLSCLGVTNEVRICNKSPYHSIIVNSPDYGFGSYVVEADKCVSTSFDCKTEPECSGFCNKRIEIAHRYRPGDKGAHAILGIRHMSCCDRNKSPDWWREIAPPEFMRIQVIQTSCVGDWQPDPTTTINVTDNYDH